MVAIGFGLLALGAWLAWSWWRHRDFPGTRWFLRAVAVSGLAAVAAMEPGWITTEVGRQPWIVYRVLKVASAVNPEPGIQYGFWAVAGIYAVLTVVTIGVLRHMPGEALIPGRSWESNSLMLAGAATQVGCLARRHRLIRDAIEALGFTVTITGRLTNSAVTRPDHRTRPGSARPPG